MSMKKKWLLLVSLLMVPSVLAQSILTNVWNKVLGVGSLSFLNISDGNAVLALTRILLWFLVFTIFFSVTTGFGGRNNVLGFLSRGQAAVVAIILATISVIFMPTSVLSATGVAWATAVALIVIGGPIVGLGALLVSIPGRGNETRGTVFIKLVLCFLIYWILSALRTHVARLGVV